LTINNKNISGPRTNKGNTYNQLSNKIFFFFFLNCHSRFLPYGFYGTLRSAVFPINFSLFLLPIGDATGLRGTFPGHPRPFHLTFTDIHNNIYTPMGTLPDGTRTRADLAVVAVPRRPWRAPVCEINEALF
jgi:hypothetical protein